MAVSVSAVGNVSFYSIVEGKIRKKVPEGTEGAVERKNKNDVIVHELCFDKMTGIITDINVEDSDYGQNIRVQLNDGDVLSLPLEGRQGGVFMKVLPNIKEGKEVEFNVWTDKETGKTAFAIKQDGENIKWAFTKENPNGLPEATSKKVGSNVKWDFSEQTNFLYERTLKEAERFKKLVVKEEPPKADTSNDEEKPNPEDLPF